uniref:hypothetical protein n=1 Tax=Actinotalea sp. C106 TaxID=2908644 RepID=UPI0020279878
MTTVTGTPAAEELRAERAALQRVVDTAATQVRDAADRLVPTGQFRDELHAVVSGRVRPYLAALAGSLHRVARGDERTAPLVELLESQHVRLAALTEDLATTRTAATSVAAAATVRTQVAAV